MGNAGARLGRGQRLQYAADASAVRLLDFWISVPEADGGMGGGMRGRAFSTLESARREDPAAEAPREHAFKHAEIVAAGAALPAGAEWDADAAFLRRAAHCRFSVAPGREAVLSDIRLVIRKARDASGAAYGAVAVGAPLPADELSRPDARIVHVHISEDSSHEEYGRCVRESFCDPEGALGESSRGTHGSTKTASRAFVATWDVFVPEAAPAGPAWVTLYALDERDAVLAKARMVLRPAGGPSARPTRSESQAAARAATLRRAVEDAQRESAFGAFSAEGLARLVSRLQATPRPPTRFVEASAKGGRRCKGRAEPPLLATTTYAPPNARAGVKAVLLLYAVDRTHVGALAAAAAQSGLAVVVADARGCGLSEGRPRGHVPRPGTALADLDALVSSVVLRECRGGVLPLLVGGYMLSAGIVLSWAARIVRHKRRTPIAGLVLISPLGGPKWHGKTTNGAAARLRPAIGHTAPALWLARATSGVLCGSAPAVRLGGGGAVARVFPAHTPRLSANYVLATVVGRRGLRGVVARLPVAVVMGARDEFQRPDAVAAHMGLPVRVVSSMVGDQLGEENTSPDSIGSVGIGDGKTPTASNATLRSDADAALAREVQAMTLGGAAKRSGTAGVRSEVVVVAGRATLDVLVDGGGLVASLALRLASSARTTPPPTIEDVPEDVLPTHLRAAYRLAGAEDDAREMAPAALPFRPAAVVLAVAPGAVARHLGRSARAHRLRVVRLDPYDARCGGRVPWRPDEVSGAVRSALRVARADFPGTPVALLAVGAPAVAAALASRPLSVDCAALLDGPRCDTITGAGRADGAKLHDWLYGCALSPNMSSHVATVLSRLGHLVVDRRVASTVQFAKPSGDSLPPGWARWEAETWRALWLDPAPYDAAGAWLGRTAAGLRPQLRAAPLPAGVAIGDFSPLALVGRGAFGHVWLARHRPSGRVLALKHIERAALRTPALRAQVGREAALLGEAAGCPFVVALVGVFGDAARVYIATEFLVGGELYARMVKAPGGRLPLEDVRFYAAEIVVGLAGLHARGIAYRDLKPENVVLDAGGHVRIVDLGFARRPPCRGRAGSFCGSPFYIAPEVLAGRGYDAYAVDAWALGVLLHEMALGLPPFPGRTADDVYRGLRAARGRGVRVTGRLSDTRLADLIEALLVFDPAERLGCGSSAVLPPGLADAVLGSAAGTPHPAASTALLAVCGHAFFAETDWAAAAAGRLRPPFVPPWDCATDTRNFAPVASGARFFPPTASQATYLSGASS